VYPNAFGIMDIELPCGIFEWDSRGREKEKEDEIYNTREV
jgi:hypothetical protein